MELTAQDIDDFAPYHTLPKFKEGYEDGAACRAHKNYHNVDGQAYDRGYMCARIHAGTCRR
jgi:hypothetical protein